jgi:hypothetical protein
MINRPGESLASAIAVAFSSRLPRRFCVDGLLRRKLALAECV